MSKYLRVIEIQVGVCFTERAPITESIYIYETANTMRLLNLIGVGRT